MCGITGIAWHPSRHEFRDEVLQEMTGMIAHRGPNDSQTWTSVGSENQGPLRAALGFRRLSIIDLEGARQPMKNEDGSIHMVFNGEIYNYQSLRKRLESAGHRYATNGDGESILHLYEDLSTNCFSELNGMFAIAIWDGPRNQMVLARDRIGQKPLYYAVKDGCLFFGSELKCLAVVEGLCEEVDPVAIDEFMAYQYVPHPRTIWKGVRKLPPGHFAVFRDGEVHVQRYWNFDPSIEQPTSLDEACERMRDLLTDSVRLRMRSDVPLGAFLSGGIDSSVITAVAQEIGNQPVRTFSIGFPVSGFDETIYAAEVARHLGTQHQRLEVTPSCVDVIDKLAWHYDEPFADSSAVPTWYLSEMAKQEVTVALSGDGGDELFAGYGRYRELWSRQRLRKRFPIHRIPAINLLENLPGSNRHNSIGNLAKRLIRGMSRSPKANYFQLMQIFDPTRRDWLYSDDFASQLLADEPNEFLENAWTRSEGRDWVSQASTTDILSYLPCDLCVKVDVASMAHGLEVRQPMLDHRLVEFAARLPVDLKFRGREGKLLLKSVFGPQLPTSVFSRKKMGFGVPIGDWLRNELKPMVHDTLLAHDCHIAPYFRSNEIEKLIQSHQESDHNDGTEYQLWSILILEKWMREWK